MRLKLILSIFLLTASLTSWAIDPFTIELYDSSCTICHGDGVGGAPKSFDANAWAKRLAKGDDVLLANAISGFKGMPPLGMCSDCTKEDLIDLIEYMSTDKAQ